MKLNSNFDGESISIVIPCFNEESNIATLYDRVKKVVNTFHIPYELILVDDGSKDKTWENISMISEIQSKSKSKSCPATYRQLTSSSHAGRRIFDTIKQ